MRKFYYDLHIHSCLSPCGDDENTPNNIAGFACLAELDVVALTDHNTCRNCPAFFEAAQRYGIIPIAGMELTTSEDIHVVCLFPDLDSAMRFDSYVDAHRIKIKNRPEFFGKQQILDGTDTVIGEEEYLLSNATDISVDSTTELVRSFGGICYPAHIDRDANGIIAVLGTLPRDIGFTYFGLHDKEKLAELATEYGIPENRFLISSDAHCLESIRDRENALMLDVESTDPEEVRRALFDLLRS